MSNIKKHQCPSCGGNLTVDNDKQMYRCAFCGSTYDYEYFREELMHEMGATYLARGEFNAAADAYRFKLKKDPHDFLSLRGLMLASARLKCMDELISEDHGKRFAFNYQFAGEAVDGASEIDKEYFEELLNIFADMRKLSKCNTEINALVKDKKRVEDAIRMEEQAYNEYTISSGYLAGKAPRPTFVFLWIIDVILFMILLCAAVPLTVLGEGLTALFVGIFFGFLTGLVAFVNITGIYPYVKDAKDLAAYIKDLYLESDMIDVNMRKLRLEAEELSAGIKTSSRKFVEKDRQIMEELARGLK